MGQGNPIEDLANLARVIVPVISAFIERGMARFRAAAIHKRALLDARRCGVRKVFARRRTCLCSCCKLIRAMRTHRQPTASRQRASRTCQRFLRAKFIAAQRAANFGLLLVFFLL
jgi:hypothetical protein